MPRDGSGIYTYPPGSPGIPDTTIESAKYNGYIADIQQDLNLPRPIVAGGTGATSAIQARDNLDAERAMATVTNYDTHVWENGSFWSATGATGAPTAGAHYGGTCIILNNDSQFIILEARNEQDTQTPGRKYVREKKTGVWGAWTVDGQDQYVNVTGDTMSGDLQLNNGTVTSPRLILSSLGFQQWLIDNASGSFRIINATGPAVRFSISPAGDATFNNSVTTMGGELMMSNGTTSSPKLTFVAQGSSSWQIDNSTGDLRFLYGGATKLYVFSGGSLSIGATSTTPGWLNILTGTTIWKEGSIYVSAAAQTALQVNINVNGNAVTFQRSGVAVGSVGVTTTNTAFNTSSDMRLKEDLKSFDAGNIVDDTNVYDFAWKSTGERSYGIIAQQAKDVYPTAVFYSEKEDWWGIDYSKYVPVILQELKGLRARVAELEGRLEAGATPA